MNILKCSNLDFVFKQINMRIYTVFKKYNIIHAYSPQPTHTHTHKLPVSVWVEQVAASWLLHSCVLWLCETVANFICWHKWDSCCLYARPSGAEASLSLHRQTHTHTQTQSLINTSLSIIIDHLPLFLLKTNQNFYIKQQINIKHLHLRFLSLMK